MFYSTKGVILSILVFTPLVHALWTQFCNFLPKVSQKRQFEHTAFPIETAELGVTVGAATFSAFSVLLFWNALHSVLEGLVNEKIPPAMWCMFFIPRNQEEKEFIFSQI